MEDESAHGEIRNERIKTADEQGILERWFEDALWSSRLIVILAVIFLDHQFHSPVHCRVP
jgi:hypothetical protein